MIKRLLPIFLSVCYVFAGERPSLIESNGVCEGRIVFKNMDSCLEVVDSGTCVATDARIAKNTPEEVTDLVVLKNPWSDMGLSPCSMHQSPPLYMVTLPHEQKIILLGTTHDFPLTCMLPYGLAQDLIEQSAFVFNEIFGELFKGGPSEVKAHFVLASLLGLNSPPKLDNLPDFCYTSKDCIKKIEDCTRAFYKQFNLLYPDQLSIESEVVKTMASIFDKNGKWYQKAGIVLRNETDDLQRTHLVIKVNGREGEVPVGKELHPAVLRLVAPYQLPLCGGMDQHLVSISLNAGKPIFALERQSERCGPGFIHAIENSNAFSFTFQCVDLQYSQSRFYSDKLPYDQSPGLVERDDLWVPRIMALDTKQFNLAFGHVGYAHLYDLFKKLKQKEGYKIEALFWADLQEILLDEPAVLREFARYKSAFRHL